MGKKKHENPNPLGIADTRDAAVMETLESGRASPVAKTLDVDPGAPLESIKHHARGDTRGRYVVLDLLGEGAMGAVYTAYDPELDRRVALKVLHPERQVSSREAAMQRLMREAKAMARLSHPNVIQVFDVGTFEGDVYIAMEFVDGQSLGRWEKGKSVDEILAAYRQAAHGLAHAHEQGVVHRDFKPDNCLVDADGRVRVIDFGIARHAEGRVMDAPELAHLTDSQETAKTRAGTLVGTPAYMSREQLEGREADARSDQFSFSVALYEALYRQRPFEGSTILSIMDSVARGAVREVPKDLDVPEWIEPILMRGLRSNASERYENMDALADALTPKTKTRSPLPVIAIAVLALAVVGGGSVMLGRASGPEATLCTDLDAPMVGVWDATRRDALDEAFTRTGTPLAQTTFDRVAAALDRRAAAWVETRTDACRATRIRGDSTETVLELRTACLDRQLHELDSTVDVLLEADQEGIERAVQVVGDLPPIERCADIARLEAAAAHRPPPDQAETVEGLRAEITRVHALHSAGRYAEAETQLTDVVSRARGTGWPPIVADALRLRGVVRNGLGRFEEAEADLFEAARRADTGHDLAIETEAWTYLVFVSGVKLHRREEALRWAQFAEDTLTELGEDPLLAGQLHYFVGLVHFHEGRDTEALAALDRSERDFRAVLGDTHHRLTLLEGVRANVLSHLGRHDEAIAAHTATVTAIREQLGGDHPDLAFALNNLSGAYRRADRLEESRAPLEEALALKRRVLGDEHPSVAVTLSNLGMLEQRLGHFDRAEALLGEARELRARTVGESHALYAQSISYEAELALDRGDAPRAIEGYRRALALQTALGQRVAIARAEEGLSFALLVGGEAREAEALARSAFTTLGTEGVEGAVVANSETTLSLALTELGRPAEAVPLAEEALAAREAATVDTETLAGSWLALGRALRESRQDDVRGRELLTRAEATFVTSAPRRRWDLATTRAALSAP